MQSNSSEIQRAAAVIRDAHYLLITAGAGMGVDSGLPDFRGDAGFWKAYPPFAALGLSFAEVAKPVWFRRDPHLAWGFYGHRLNLYRATAPHAGFAILKRWAQDKPAWVYTSNVDGQFQKAGFDSICEVHGSIHHFQCTLPCLNDVWDAPPAPIEVDESTFRAQGELPRCPHCDALARPNILMFSDGAWVVTRSSPQENALFAWTDARDARKLVVIEMGAGKAIPTVRYLSEHYQKKGATLVRINPRESDGPNGTLSLPMGALDALESIDAVLTGA